MRSDNRRNDELRKINITRNYLLYPEGSVLIEWGNTKIICTATVEEKVPPFLIGKEQGWISAEYSMLPGATATRNQRDIAKLKKSPRSVEIQRLIARSLRAGADLSKLKDISIIVDCDVIQADGGTRCASITGGFVALYDACIKLMDKGILLENPIKQFVSAVSIGIVSKVPMLDLCYEEDSSADVDFNAIMTEDGRFAEIQGTGENNTFSMEELHEILKLAKIGNDEIIQMQKKSLEIL